jgi:hypothetical protein
VYVILDKNGKGQICADNHKGDILQALQIQGRQAQYRISLGFEKDEMSWTTADDSTNALAKVSIACPTGLE